MSTDINMVGAVLKPWDSMSTDINMVGAVLKP